MPNFAKPTIGTVIIPKTLTPEVVKILTNRLADEYTAHYFYKNAANWCKGVAYNNAGAFYEAEAASELSHAYEIQDYLVSWNALPEIPKVNTVFKFDSLPDTIEKSYKLELDLFEKYNNDSSQLFPIDLTTFDFLTDFRKKQTASVAEYSDLLNALELFNLENKLDIIHFEEIYFKA